MHVDATANLISGLAWDRKGNINEKALSTANIEKSAP